MKFSRDGGQCNFVVCNSILTKTIYSSYTAIKLEKMDSGNTEYHVQREIIDEQRLKERSQRMDPSQINLPISHRLKKSLR